jgi:hypothetical protein
MANTITVSCDPTELLARLDGQTLGQALAPFVKAAARISADRIVVEAAGRLSRQLSGTSTGATVAGIKVRSSGAYGWSVVSGNAKVPMLPRWLENKFKAQGRRKPFLMASATLEQTAHTKRIDAAIQAGLSEYGLGDEQG